MIEINIIIIKVFFHNNKYNLSRIIEIKSKYKQI